MIGLGFVVAKFSVWLRELAVRINEPIHAKHTGMSLPLGVAMMSAGGLLALIAAGRYRRVRRAIEEGQSAADTYTVMLVTLMTLIITAALILYMLVSI